MILTVRYHLPKMSIFLKQNKSTPKLKMKIQLNLEQSDTILLIETCLELHHNLISCN